MIIGRKKLLAAVHVRAAVTQRVSSVNLCMLTVKGFERWYENQSGIWSILRMYRLSQCGPISGRRLARRNANASLATTDGARVASLVCIRLNICELLQPTFCHHEFGIERFVGEFGADELLCLPHNLRDGDGHPLLMFLEQPRMELVLHSFELANRTSAQAQALALDFCLLPQLNVLLEPLKEYIMWDLYVNRDFSD